MTEQTSNQPSSVNLQGQQVSSFDGICAVSKIGPRQVKVVDKTANFTFYYKLLRFVQVVQIMFGGEKAKRVAELLGEGQSLIVDFQNKKILRVKPIPPNMSEVFFNEHFSRNKIDEYLGTNPKASFKSPNGAFWQNI